MYETLSAGDGETITIFTPWTRRMADNAVFMYELVHLTSGASFDVEIYLKSSDDPGSGSAIVGSPPSWTQDGDFFSLTVDNLNPVALPGLKEMIRFKITFQVAGGGGMPGTVVYRFMEPTWYDQAQA